MLKWFKQNVSLIFIFALTFLCGTIDFYGMSYTTWVCLILIWHFSFPVILIAQKKNIIKGINYIRHDATDAEAFAGICSIGVCFVWVFIIAALTIFYPLDFCGWAALEVPYETYTKHLFWYTLQSLTVGMAILVFFCFVCSLLCLPFRLIGRSIFKDDYIYVRFPNVWLDFCAFPIALFAYITQLTGAADIYGAFIQLLEFLS